MKPLCQMRKLMDIVPAKFVSQEVQPQLKALQNLLLMEDVQQLLRKELVVNVVLLREVVDVGSIKDVVREIVSLEYYNIKHRIMKIEAIKPGPKPKKQDGTHDKRRRDNKSTQGNTPKLKPSKSTKKK